MGVLVVVVPVAVGVFAAVDILESRDFGYQSGLRLFKVRIRVSLRFCYCWSWWILVAVGVFAAVGVLETRDVG